MRAIGVISILAAATVATIPAAIIGLTSIAIGAGMDTIQTYNLRRSKKEHSLLIKNRNAKSKQDQMLELEPKIANALKNELYIPERKNKRSVTERYRKLREEKVSPSSWGKALFKSSISAIKTVGAAIAQPGVVSIGKIALSIKGIYGEANKQLTKKQIGREFKAGVNSERDKADTPGYDDLTELAEKVRKQRIQSLAIQKLIISGKYRTASQKEIRAEFQQLKQDIEKTEAAVVSRRGIINKTRIMAKSFVKAHNPFSKYTQLDKLRRHKKKLSSLSIVRTRI